jgi:regulator of nucleoside diphosphate kinase
MIGFYKEFSMSRTATMVEKNLLLTQQDFDRLIDLTRSRQYRATFGGIIADLERELQRGSVVAPADAPKGVVTMHSRVRVRDAKSDESDTYVLVYPPEADISQGRLSVLSPLGMALLGERSGKVVEFDAPAGTRRLKIEKVLYQPEAAGDFHL